MPVRLYRACKEPPGEIYPNLFNHIKIMEIFAGFER